MSETDQYHRGTQMLVPHVEGGGGRGTDVSL